MTETKRERYIRILNGLGGADISAEACKELVELLKEQPHWIPCSERLPEEDGAYIVSGKWGSGKVSVGECEYFKHDGYFNAVWNFDVTAWMPLPEPYRESEECENN